MESASHDCFMRVAIEQAERALERGDLPIGAVIVHRGNVVGAACNAIEADQSKIAHAEMRVLHACAIYLLTHARECVLYTTHEPCIMCLGAVAVCNIRTIVYGLSDPESLGHAAIAQIQYLNAHIDHYVGGVLEEECRRLWIRYDALRKPGLSSETEPTQQRGANASRLHG